MPSPNLSVFARWPSSGRRYRPVATCNLTGSGSLTLRYVVNGASLWMRGSNVIPLDEFAGRATGSAILHLEGAPPPAWCC